MTTIEIRRILCPVDFSDPSRRAIDHAVAIAKAYGAAVTLFHVYNIVPRLAYTPGVPNVPTVRLPDDARAELLAALGTSPRPRSDPAWRWSAS